MLSLRGAAATWQSWIRILRRTQDDTPYQVASRWIPAFAGMAVGMFFLVTPVFAQTPAASTPAASTPATGAAEVGNCIVTCEGTTCTATPPPAGQACCPAPDVARAACEASGIGDGPNGIFAGGQCTYVTTHAECDQARPELTAQDAPGRRTTVTFAGAPAPAAPDRTGGGRYGLNNPLGTVSLPAIIGRVIRAAIGIVGALFLVMFLYGGLLWMTAGGEQKKIEGARSALVNATIGLLVVAFSYTIIALLFGFVGSLAGKATAVLYFPTVLSIPNFERR